MDHIDTAATAEGRVFEDILSSPAYYSSSVINASYLFY